MCSKQEDVIIAIRGEGLAEDDGDNDDAAATTRPERITYALHPNCGIFEDE